MSDPVQQMTLEASRRFALDVMERRLAAIREGSNLELFWLAADALKLTRLTLAGDVNDDEVQALRELVTQLGKRIDRRIA